MIINVDVIWSDTLMVYSSINDIGGIIWSNNKCNDKYFLHCHAAVRGILVVKLLQLH